MTLYENIIKREINDQKENEKIFSLYENIFIEDILKDVEINEGQGWIEAAKKVKKEHQMVYVHPKTNKISDDKKKGYIVLDAMTANMLVTVYDALKSENQKKFTSMPLAKAVNIGWQLVK